MKLHAFHDLYRNLHIFQAVLTDEEVISLPSWLTPPTTPDICQQLKFLTEVAKYLQQQEEENSMPPIDPEDDATETEPLETDDEPEETIDTDELDDTINGDGEEEPATEDLEADDAAESNKPHSITDDEIE